MKTAHYAPIPNEDRLAFCGITLGDEDLVCTPSVVALPDDTEICEACESSKNDICCCNRTRADHPNMECRRWHLHDPVHHDRRLGGEKYR